MLAIGGGPYLAQLPAHIRSIEAAHTAGKKRPWPAGRAHRGAAGREIRPAKGNDPRDSRTPTTPCPPSAAHWAVILPRAVRRAWSMASTSGPNDPASPRPDTWVTGRPGVTPPDDPRTPGQL